MVKHTQIIRGQKPFDHFVRLELKRLIKKGISGNFAKFRGNHVLKSLF